MTRQKFALLALIPFSMLTTWALLDGGLTGILAFHQTPGGWQVFIDLVIALALVLSFLVPDARANGRNPWPWVIATLCLGSFGPLLYFVTAKRREA